MSSPSNDETPNREDTLAAIVGLGEQSLKKSYYPQLQGQIEELRQAKAQLEWQTAMLTEALAKLKQAHQQVEENEHRFHAIFNHVADAIFLLEPDTGRIVEANSRMCDMFACQPAEALQMDPGQLGTGEPPYTMVDFKAKLHEAFQGKPQLFEWHAAARNGRQFWLEIRMHRAPVGAQDRILVMARDISEQKLMSEKLRQSQKMETFGLLAGGVAHDFNNILSVIVMNSEVLNSQKNLDADGQEAASQIAEAAHRGANLTRQLLTFSRRQPLKRRFLDFRQVAENFAKMLQRIIGENIEFQCQMPREPLPVYADEGMLEQVLMNLAVNARDAMPQGGTLKLAAEIVNRTPISLRPGEPPKSSRQVCVVVKDTGSGIPPEVLPRIFEPFFTTKEAGKGTGLGLATVDGIVRQHEGWIEVESELGEGSTFQVFLPFAPGMDATQDEKTLGTELQHGSEGILVVEDQESVRRLIVRFLRNLGYHVEEAAQGMEAWERWHELETKVDLLITDMVMPGGISGKDLAERLRQVKPRLRVLYISGFNTVTNEENLARTRFYLPKPFTLAELAKAVRECLDATDLLAGE